MPIIYIIAGPPGIGKSTTGKNFLPPDIETLNHDKFRQYYKANEDVNYEDLSNLKANNFIREQLRLSKDFGVELNLGYESHFDLLRFVKNQYPQYKISICLYFTDEIQICIDRAKIREKYGGHSVSEKVIYEMYENTITLFRKNSYLIDSIKLIDISYSFIDLSFELNPDENLLFINSQLPNWIVRNFPKITELQNKKARP
jgi:predicted ABC-type ATPase